jgi:methionyl-tRNA formyltransferase
VTGGPGAGQRVRTVFLGSGPFGRESLWRLDDHPAVRLVGVVTAPPRPFGRRQLLAPTIIAKTAAELGVKVILAPERLRAADAVAGVLALEPELLVLADYGQIVPASLLGLRHGALNLHPSLLPRHRGASPIPAAILAGDAETGVTLMRMDSGLDTGPIVAQATVPLDGTETAPALEERLELVADDLLDRSLGPWVRGELTVRPQPADGATITRPLTREDGRLDATRPAAELERRVRAYLPWPGTFLEAAGERLVVSAASVAPGEPGDLPGTLVRHGALPALATADGRLVLVRVTPPGKRQMSGQDWLRGRRDRG